MKNYPDDVSPSDPRAPWNQPEVPDFKEDDSGECELCKKECELNDFWLCAECWYEHFEEYV